MRNRRSRKPRAKTRTNAQIKASMRNFAKFRLAGAETSINDILSSVPLTAREKLELKAASVYIGRSLNSWNDFKKKLKR